MADPDPDRDAERYLVVGGRRWRRQDPTLPADVAASLRSHLGRARARIGADRRAGRDPAPQRARVDAAKRGLGERGDPWWEQDTEQRRARWTAALHTLAERDDQTSRDT